MNKKQRHLMYYNKHKDNILAKQKVRYEAIKHTEKYKKARREKQKRYYHNNPHTFKKNYSYMRRQMDYNKKREAKCKEEIFYMLGNICKNCGFSDKRALQVDHVNGNGSQERKKTGSTRSALLKQIKLTPFNYQILCANCNWIKRFEKGENRKSKMV